MAYTINKTDGSLLTEIIDSAIDTTATDLSLIGKNVTGYGELINENFVKLLENFASTSEPNNPIAGQLWFDQTDNRLKVYDGNGFAIASGPVVSGTAPLTPNQGDFWIDNTEKQLYFYDGTRSRFLAGKIWGDNQGKSGFEVNTISDQFGNRRTVTYLWNAGNLLGIFSNHLEFTPSAAISGITTVKPGFTISTNVTNFKLHAAAESADFLKSSTGELIPAEDFLIFNQSNNLTETLSISNTQPLILGAGAEASILVGNGLTEIRNQIGQDFKISILDNPDPIFYAKVSSKRIGIFNNDPQAALDVTGNVIVSGNLTVNGNTTTINTSELIVEDKNITVSSGAVDAEAADGSGITVDGANASLTYNYVNTAWTSSENFNLAVEKSYKINGEVILSDTELGSSVVTSNLQSVGVLNSLTVDTTRIDDGIITSTAGTLTISSATSIINVSDKRITNLADPIPAPQNPETPDFGLTDAVNRRYVDARVPKPWSFSNDVLQFAEDGDRFLVDTISAPAVISLPANPQPGTNVRFIDYNGSFGTNPLTVVRAREIDTSTLSGDNIGATLGTYYDVVTTAVTGTGTGLILEITTTANASYLANNTSIVVVNPGVDYKDGDQITVLGSSLGGVDGTNNLTFALELKNILSVDEDYLSDLPNAAFSLIFTSPSQGWQFTDSVNLPLMLFADLTGNVVGNVTGNVVGNVTGNVTGDVLGDLTGDVTGDVLGNLTGDVLGNLTGDVLGDLTGDVTGDVVGDLTGDLLNCSTITAQNNLTVESVNSNVKIISGNGGLLLSAYDNLRTQEQYAIQVTPATASGNRSTTLLFGNVVIANQTAANINGASFRLPSYTTAERDAITMSFLNYGEIIHNTSLSKIQAYVAPGTWVDLN
jgi:hypothetical protein